MQFIQWSCIRIKYWTPTFNLKATSTEILSEVKCLQWTCRHKKLCNNVCMTSLSLTQVPSVTPGKIKDSTCAQNEQEMSKFLIWKHKPYKFLFVHLKSFLFYALCLWRRRIPWKTVFPFLFVFSTLLYGPSPWLDTQFIWDEQHRNHQDPMGMEDDIISNNS